MSAAGDCRRMFTVWQFRSLDGADVRIVAKIAEPGDVRCQHEYQIVLGQVLAASRAEALGIVARERGSRLLP